MYKEPASPKHPRRYVVKVEVTGGAAIRVDARQDGEIIGMLNPGDWWTGEEVIGGGFSAPGFPASNIWVKDAGYRVVWRGFLEGVD